MNFLKGVWAEISNWKRTVAVIAIVIVTMLLIGPWLIRILRMIPGVGKVLDKAPGAVAVALLGVALMAAGTVQAQEPGPQVVAMEGQMTAAPLFTEMPAMRMPDAPQTDVQLVACTIAITALFCVGAGVLLLRAKRSEWKFSPTAAAVLAFVGLGLWSATAVPPVVQRHVTSIIVSPAGGADEDTNGVLRLISQSRTNYFLVASNQEIRAFSANGWYTGWTGRIIYTNAFGGGGWWTSSFWNGLCVGTNGLAPAAVQ